MGKSQAVPRAKQDCLVFHKHREIIHSIGLPP